MYRLCLSFLVIVLSGCASTKNQTTNKQSQAKPASNTVVKSKKLASENSSKSTGDIINSENESRVMPMTAFSSQTDNNVPARIHDNDLATRWSSKGKNAWIVLDYGKVISFDAVRISFYKGDQRSSRFKVQLSKDGRKWIDAVKQRQSSGKTSGYERYSFPLTKARYVKYVGFGNTSNIWNSVNEMNAVNCTVNSCEDNELISF